MRQYIIENEDGEWEEYESTPMKEATRRCPRVIDGMVEIGGIKYVVDPSKMRREKYTPRWIKAVAFIVFLSAGFAFTFNQVVASSSLLFLGLVVLASTRFIKGEMQIQLWYRDNPDAIPLFSGHPLPNGITGSMISRYSKARHIEKVLNPNETNWYAIIAILAILGMLGAIVALYFRST